MSQASALELVKGGIAASKVGDKPRARQLLHQSVGVDPRCEAGWLWLAGLAESPAEALGHLLRVLEINPGHERARAAARAARLQAGVAAARAKDPTGARALLRGALAEDPDNEMALHWLATVAESPQDSVACLERVLALNPANDRARGALERYRAQLPAASPPRPAAPPPRPAAATPPPPPPDEPTQPWRCPLCEAEDEKEPDRCDNCGGYLTLDDPEAFFGQDEADADLFLAAAERLEAAGGEDFDSQLDLALAYLNGGRFDDGLARLREAARLRPADRELRAAAEVVGRMAADRTEAALAAAALEEGHGAAGPKTILVVDDSPTIRKLVTMTVERRGFRALAAGDGREAVAVIRDRGVPDLILLDITMPGMDGYQLCKLLRQSADTAEVPIIMLSGKDGFFSKVRGRMAGSTEYITKPFEPEGLLRAVERYCPAGAPVPAAARR